MTWKSIQTCFSLTKHFLEAEECQIYQFETIFIASLMREVRSPSPELLQVRTQDAPCRPKWVEELYSIHKLGSSRQMRSELD